jgi:hypothetical protein
VNPSTQKDTSLKLTRFADNEGMGPRGQSKVTRTIGWVLLMIPLVLWLLSFFVGTETVLELPERYSQIGKKTRQAGGKESLSQPAGIFSVSSGKSQIQVENKKGQLSPTASDFALSLWIKPSKLPAVGERFQIVDCYSDSSGTVKSPGSKAGYSIAIAAERDGIRPMVYWYGEGNEGRWYSFSQFPLHAHEWFQFLLVWHSQDHVLELQGLADSPFIENPSSDGAHSSTSWQKAGAYRLPDISFSKVQNPLKIGAVGDKRFRGTIGSVRVISGRFDQSKVLDVIRSSANSSIARTSDALAPNGTTVADELPVVLELISTDSIVGNQVTNSNFPLDIVYGAGKRFTFVNSGSTRHQIKLFGGKSRGVSKKRAATKASSPQTATNLD